jgi:hypothetical protein
MDRYTGGVAWDWKSPKGTASHVSIMLDGDRLIVSVQGYLYCLDPLYGQEVWRNPLKGYGTGIAGLTSARAQATSAGAAAAAKAAQDQQAAAAAAAAS